MKTLAILLACSACGVVPTSTVGGGSTPAMARSAPASPPPDYDPSAEVAMPNVIGKTLAEATQILRAAGFRDPPREDGSAVCYDVDVPPETISCQDRAPGTSVRTFHELAVRIHHAPSPGTGITTRDLGTLMGMTVADAKLALARMGFEGVIEVGPTAAFVTGCKLDTICGFEPQTTFAHDSGRLLKLYVNPRTSFSTPAP